MLPQGEIGYIDTDGKWLIPNGFSRVEFEWPGGKIAFDSHKDKAMYEYAYQDEEFYQYLNHKLPIWDGNKVTLNFFSLLGDGLYFPNHLIYDSAATQKRYFAGIPGYVYSDSVIIPSNSIKIPSSGTVTFNISWNINDVIEVYEGETASANDDIFILRNGWWESLYIHVTYE